MGRTSCLTEGQIDAIDATGKVVPRVPRGARAVIMLMVGSSLSADPRVGKMPGPGVAIVVAGRPYGRGRRL